MPRIRILLLCLVFPLVVWAEFDEPIDGPTGMSFFFDFRRNHLMVYNVPLGDLQSYLYVPAYDVAYWPKEKAMLYTYDGLEIRAFNIWGDLNDTLIIDREMLGESEYWVYVRLEVREDWILGGAIDISTSRLNLYRLKKGPNEGSYNITLLASENVLSSKNLIIHPTLSPSTRHVYAVGEFGIFRVSYDGGDSELVLEDEFAINPTVIELGIREECRTYSLIRPAVITTSTRTNVTITTAISSAGNVPYQYFSYFDRLRFTGTGFELPDTAVRRFNQLDPTTLLLPRNDEKRAERQGVYIHKIVTPLGDEETIVAVLQSPGKISFDKPTITANRGDTVRLSVPKPHFIRLRWRRNGRMIRRWSHLGSITLYNVTRKDSGIYESHLTTLRSLGNHAIMRLIVRECPAGYCNPPSCTEECPTCYNGGFSRRDTVHGEICICAPGFMGSNCEKATDRGTYGQNGELSCPNEGCRGILFCQVDPYGCSCMSGLMGPDCKTPCSIGSFGPNCMVECHCSDNSLCNRRTGRCGNGICETGWRGFNCQVPTS